MDKEKLKQELIKFAEWQENTILPDTNEEMANDYLKQYVVLPQADVIKSVCEKCRFKDECRYKEMNTEQNCKYFIDEQTVL